MYRVVSDQAEERTTYSDPVRYYEGEERRIVNGDVIWDSFTNPSIKSVYITDFSTAMSGMRTGGTIWVQNPSGDPYHSYRLTNGGTPSGKSDANNKVWFTPINDQVLFRMDTSVNPNSYALDLQDFEYLVVLGENDNKPGLRDGWGSNRTGTFGFLVDKEGDWTKRDDMIAIGGWVDQWEIVGAEIAHGFSKVRSHPAVSGASREVEMILRRCYIRGDGGKGEPLYLGDSGGGPDWPLLKNFLMEDCIVVRGGREGLQLHHIVEGSREAQVRNCIFWGNTANWKIDDQNFHNLGIQWSYDQGRITMRDCIIHGAGQNLIRLAEENGTSSSYPVRFQNVLILDGRNRGVYSNGTTTVKVQFDHCYFGNLNGTNVEVFGGTTATEHIQVADAIETHLKHCKYKNDKTFYTDNVTDIHDIDNTAQATIEKPSYVNESLGIDPEQYENWGPIHGNGQGWPAVEQWCDYKVDDRVHNSAEGNGDGKIYRCLQNHNVKDYVTTIGDATFDFTGGAQEDLWTLNSHGLSVGQIVAFTVKGAGAPEYDIDVSYIVYDVPDTNTFRLANILSGNLIQGTADSSGTWTLVRPKLPNEDSTNWVLEVDNIPADDFRLVKDSVYEKLGMGLSCNESSYLKQELQVKGFDNVWRNLASVDAKKHTYGGGLSGKTYRYEIRYNGNVYHTNEIVKS